MRFLLYIVLVVCLAVSWSQQKKPSTPYWPSKGQVTPKPRHQIIEKVAYVVDKSFYILSDNHTCNILKNAIRRYLSICKKQVKANYNNSQMESLQYLKIVLNGTCDDQEYPHLYMDESYNLTVLNTAELKSFTIWGVLRGLETFAQLIFWDDFCELVAIRGTTIIDSPHYPHRGLMLDTGSSYVAVKTVLRTLDAMALNKMNVFHWHIVDNESFPFHSELFPELSKKGAFFGGMIYTKADIKRIVEYGRQRGIRILPEFRMPENNYALGLSHPELVFSCDGTLNPLLVKTYEFLRDLFREVQELFPDEYLHMGGMNPDFRCWWDYIKMRKYLETYRLRDVSQVYAMFHWYAAKALRPGTKPVYWQDVFLLCGRMPNRTVFQIYSGEGFASTIRILKAGYLLIHSKFFNVTSYRDFETYYLDPRQEMEGYMQEFPELLDNVLGGEALVYSDSLDDTRMISRTWPLASAVAEVLWSNVTRGPQDGTFHRMEEQTCRMIYRDIQAYPIFGYKFCHNP